MRLKLKLLQRRKLKTQRFKMEQRKKPKKKKRRKQLKKEKNLKQLKLLFFKSKNLSPLIKLKQKPQLRHLMMKLLVIKMLGKIHKNSIK